MSDSSDREIVETAANRYEKLLRLLADDEESAAEVYMLLRRRLVAYFEGRRISPAEDFADEVLHRTAERVDTGEKIDNINHYVFGIARFVRLESFRRLETETIDRPEGEMGSVKMPESLRVEPKVNLDGTDGYEGPMQTCLHECLAKLAADKKELLLAYYAVDESRGTYIEQRKALARRLGKAAGALQKQVCLLRQKVSECAHNCVQRELG